MMTRLFYQQFISEKGKRPVAGATGLLYTLMFRTNTGAAPLRLLKVISQPPPICICQTYHITLLYAQKYKFFIIYPIFFHISSKKVNNIESCRLF
jgi:hypothetical protein